MSTMSIAKKAKKAADLFDQWREKSTLSSTELEYAENQLFRFNLWTSNNYVFESPRASIDWRLRNAPLLQSAMDDLLDDLIMSLIGAQNTPRQLETENPSTADAYANEKHTNDGNFARPQKQFSKNDDANLKKPNLAVDAQAAAHDNDRRAESGPKSVDPTSERQAASHTARQANGYRSQEFMNTQQQRMPMQSPYYVSPPPDTTRVNFNRSGRGPVESFTSQSSRFGNIANNSFIPKSFGGFNDRQRSQNYLADGSQQGNRMPMRPPTLPASGNMYNVYPFPTEINTTGMYGYQAVNSTPMSAMPYQEDMANVEGTLDLLFRFSRAIRRSGILHRLVKIANHNEYSPDGVNLTSEFHMATSRIIDHYLKGCNASPELRERLVDTICLRKRNFSYLKSQKKARSAPMKVLEELPSRARSTFTPSFSVMTPVTTTGHKEKPIQFEPRLDLRRSLMTATTAQVDHVPLDRSIQSSIGAPQPEVSDEDPELPRPPVVPSGRKEWECPYCLVVCPIKEFRPENWKKHIVADIMPYLCVLESCPMSTALFKSKKDWLSHMKNGHKLESWTCLDHDTKLSFPRISDFFQHMHDQHSDEFEEDDLHDLADACFESIAMNTKFDLCPFCPENGQKNTIPADGGIQHLASHLILFSRISFDRYIEEQNPSSDFSSSTDQTGPSSKQIVSETITDGLQPGFFEHLEDHDSIHFDLLESHQVPPDPGEENWELFLEMQKSLQQDINEDPILQGFSQNHPEDVQFTEPISIPTKGLFRMPSFHIEHQIKLDELYRSETGYIAYLHYIQDSYRSAVPLRDKKETFTIQLQLSKLIRRHNMLVGRLHYRKDQQQEKYIDTLGDWLDEAKFHFMEYFEVASELLRQDHVLDLPQFESFGSPIVGIDINNHLETPRWRFERYRHFISSVHERNSLHYTQRRSTASVIQQINKLLNYADFLHETGSPDTIFYLPYDRSHVADKFPNAEQAIVNRLGLAIAQRRSLLQYRQRQRDERNELDEAIKRDTDGDENVKLLDNDHKADKKGSQPSEPSGISWAADTGTRGNFYSLPKLPMKGKPFECEFCFSVLSITDQRLWISHVFADLKPYFCFYPDCPTPNRLYEYRRELFDHLRNQHAISDNPDLHTDCPLCQDSYSSGKQFERHLGRHLEQLMLFALPRSNETKHTIDTVSQTTFNTYERQRVGEERRGRSLEDTPQHLRLRRSEAPSPPRQLDREVFREMMGMRTQGDRISYHR
ncbi:unnamed protein product [Penicillium manginii]